MLYQVLWCDAGEAEWEGGALFTDFEKARAKYDELVQDGVYDFTFEEVSGADRVGCPTCGGDLRKLAPGNYGCTGPSCDLVWADQDGELESMSLTAWPLTVAPTLLTKGGE